MTKAQEVRNANGNLRLAWLIIENTIEPEHLSEFTLAELKQVKSVADERLLSHIDELLCAPTTGIS